MHQDENDETIACHFGTRVRKNHTSKRGAFQTVGGNPAFFIIEQKIHQNTNDKFFKTEKFEPKISIDTNVVLIKYYPGFSKEIFEKILDSGVKAIIFENIMAGKSKTIEKAIEKSEMKTLSESEINNILDKIVEEKKDLISNQKDRAIGPLMGIAMKKLRGKTSGKTINRLLLQKINQFLK